MKTFLAVFTGTARSLERSGWHSLDELKRQERQREGIRAWTAWVERNQPAILDYGSPLGKTKCVSSAGVRDCKNALTAYVVIQAPSHEAAAALFEGHPHFTIFPGESVDVMECLPIPSIEAGQQP